jgi:hypothetical protein
MKDLNTEFATVRKQFFPRWDREGRWRLRLVDDLFGAQGKCDSDAKEIKIAFRLTGDELHLLLIHEIAHAVTGGGHGQIWQTRMLKAAQQAECLEHPDMALALRKEVEAYKNTPRETAKEVYDRLEDQILIGSFLPTFEQLVEFVSRDYGLSPNEFLQQFRAARKVYDRVKVEKEDIDLKQASLKARI